MEKTEIQKVESKGNNVSLVMSILALTTSLLFFLVVPVVFLILGWTYLKNGKKRYRKAAQAMLIITSCWLGIKVFVILSWTWLMMINA